MKLCQECKYFRMTGHYNWNYYQACVRPTGKSSLIDGREHYHNLSCENERAAAPFKFWRCGKDARFFKKKQKGYLCSKCERNFEVQAILPESIWMRTGKIPSYNGKVLCPNCIIGYLNFVYFSHDCIERKIIKISLGETEAIK